MENYLDTNREEIFLVTGATGTIGTHVVKQLVEAGKRVRALTRNPKQTKIPEGVEIVTGDLTDPKTLECAFKGVTAMHLIAFNDNKGYEPLNTGLELMELAKKSGIKRITVLTGTDGELDLFNAVQNSDLEWTHVRPPGEFMANILNYAPAIRSEQLVRLAFPDVPDAMIDEADVAAILVAALLENTHTGKTYEPTGPEVITRRDAIQQIAGAIGKNIHLVELSKQQFREEMLTAGINEEVADFVIAYKENPPPEAYTVVLLVKNITGKPPRKFKDWVNSHQELFSGK